MMPATQRKPWKAGLWSLVLPGLGQIYNGNAQKGLAFYVLYLAVGLVVYAVVMGSPVRPFYRSMSILLVLVLYVYILDDATSTARRYRETFQQKFYNKWYVYGLLAILLFIFQLLGFLFVTGVLFVNASRDSTSLASPSAASSFPSFLESYAKTVPTICQNTAYVQCLGVTTTTCTAQEEQAIDVCIKMNRRTLSNFHEKVVSHRETLIDDMYLGFQMGQCVPTQFELIGGYPQDHLQHCEYPYTPSQIFPGRQR